jgi:hypothetical protein
VSRLLLLACSQTKSTSSTPSDGMYRAIDYYDGPAWRTLRSYLRNRGPGQPNLNVWAISAEYGLIPAELCISPYNRKLDMNRARELLQDSSHAAELHFALQDDPEVLVWGSGLYAGLVTSWMGVVAEDYTYRCCVDGARGIGDMLGELSRWLPGGER